MSRYLSVLHSAFRAAAPAFAASLLAVAVAGEVLAQQDYDDKATAEGWAWALIRQGKPVDMGDRCAEMNVAVSSSIDKPDWKNTCRRLSPTFVVDVLTKLPRRDQMPSGGLIINGAWIEGSIDLTNAKLTTAVQLERSVIHGDVILESARTDKIISISASRIEGKLRAPKLKTEMSLVLAELQVTDDVWLWEAKLEGGLDMRNASVKGDFFGNALIANISLYLPESEFRSLTLVEAQIAGSLNLRGATVAGDLNLNSLRAGSVLLDSTEKPASFQELDLRAATVSGNVSMIGASFAGPVSFNTLSARHLFMRSTNSARTTFKKDINLVVSRFTGNVEMDGSLFEGRIDAHAMMWAGRSIWA